LNSDEFADFYLGSFDRVLAVVGAFCGDGDVAYEATQEAFARAYSRWTRLQQHTSPKGWVTTTALNLTRRHFGGRTRKAVYLQQENPAGPNPDRVDVLAALLSLPERQRQAVVLHYFLDCSVASVADLMGVSEGAVKAHLHKARASLRLSLEVRHA
jgi:RNA polymerase sigma-70 factor (ECF subfamily)